MFASIFPRALQADGFVLVSTITIVLPIDVTLVQFLSDVLFAKIAMGLSTRWFCVFRRGEEPLRQSALHKRAASPI